MGKLSKLKNIFTAIFAAGIVSGCVMFMAPDTTDAALSKPETVELVGNMSPIAIVEPISGEGNMPRYEVITRHARGVGQYFTATIRGTGEATISGLAWNTMDETLPVHEQLGACARNAQTGAICSVSDFRTYRIEEGADYPKGAEFVNHFDFDCSDGVYGTAEIAVNRFYGIGGEGELMDGRQFDVTVFDLDRVDTEIQCLKNQ